MSKVSERIEILNIFYEYIRNQYSELSESYRQINSRVSNLLALLAAFIVLSIPAFAQMSHLNEYCKIKMLFVVSMILSLIFILSLFYSIYLVIKMLKIEYSIPIIMPDGIRQLISSGYDNYDELLQSFIENYLRTFEDISQITKRRNELGNCFMGWIKRTFIIWIIFLLTFWAVRIFFCANPDIVNIQIQKGKVIMMSVQDDGQGNESGGANGGSGSQAADSSGSDSAGTSQPSAKPTQSGPQQSVEPQPTKPTLQTNPAITGEPTRIKLGEDTRPTKVETTRKIIKMDEK